jgi:hypothetical protein
MDRGILATATIVSDRRGRSNLYGISAWKSLDTVYLAHAACQLSAWPPSTLSDRERPLLPAGVRRKRTSDACCARSDSTGRQTLIAPARLAQKRSALTGRPPQGCLIKTFDALPAIGSRHLRYCLSAAVQLSTTVTGGTASDGGPGRRNRWPSGDTSYIVGVDCGPNKLTLGRKSAVGWPISSVV